MSPASMTFATGQIDLDHSIILAKCHIVVVPEMINGVSCYHLITILKDHYYVTSNNLGKLKGFT